MLRMGSVWCCKKEGVVGGRGAWLRINSLSLSCVLAAAL